jgi:hypothetical protein
MKTVNAFLVWCGIVVLASTFCLIAAATMWRNLRFQSLSDYFLVCAGIASYLALISLLIHAWERRSVSDLTFWRILTSGSTGGNNLLKARIWARIFVGFAALAATSMLAAAGVEHLHM